MFSITQGMAPKKDAQDLLRGPVADQHIFYVETLLLFVPLIGFPVDL